MSSVSLQTTEDPRIVYFHGNTFSYKDIISAMPGRRWDKKLKRWELPIESVADALRIFPTLGISADVRKLHNAMQERQQAALDAKAANVLTVVPQDIHGLKGNLRPYQQVGTNFLMTMEEGEGGVLAFDMGLGKSITGLALYLLLRKLGIVDKLMIVCPSPLKYATWAKEVQKFTDLEYIVIDGDKPEVVTWDDGVTEKLEGRALREVQYQQHLYGVPVTIMNYELFRYDGESKGHTHIRYLTEEEMETMAALRLKYSVQLNKAESNKRVKKKAIDDMLHYAGLNPRRHTVRGSKKPEFVETFDLPKIMPNIDKRWMVILDEAHRIKNPTSETTKALLKTLEPANRKVLGTGTPLENNIQELWSLVDFCRPGLLGSYPKFIERYAELDFFGNPIAPKPQMMDELRKKIAPIMIRVTKAEALPHLPPLERVNYDVHMTPLQKKLYGQIKQGIIESATTGEFTYIEALVQITRVQQCVDSPALLRKLFENPDLPEEGGKLNLLKDILTDLNVPANKFILFSQYREMTDILYDWLEREGVLPKSAIGYIKGGTKAADFERVRSGFQDYTWGQPGNLQCVLMTTAGNYGLDLYNARYVICFDELFNPQKMEQILSRGHRSGNTTGVTAITMTTVDSYEERKRDMLERKREVFSAIVDESDEAFAKLFTTKELLELI